MMLHTGPDKFNGFPKVSIQLSSDYIPNNNPLKFMLYIKKSIFFYACVYFLA